MEEQNDRCKIVQVRVNLSDGTPSAKAILPDVKRTLRRLLKEVERRAETWGEYDYAMLDAREELVQMQQALGADSDAFPLQFGKQTTVYKPTQSLADVGINSSHKRKSKQKSRHKQRQARRAKQANADAHVDSSKPGDVVMAWMDTMYYPAQIVNASFTDDERLYYDVYFLGWDQENPVSVWAEWCTTIPDEYASAVDLSSYIVSYADVQNIDGVIGSNPNCDEAACGKADDEELEMQTEALSDVHNDATPIPVLRNPNGEAEQCAVVNSRGNMGYEDATRIQSVAQSMIDAGASPAGNADSLEPNDDGTDVDVDAEGLQAGYCEDDAQKPSDDIPDKYWDQRYRYFARYDHGVELDVEGWYSVTPEILASYLAYRCRGHAVIDLFAGVGGNAIAFAKLCKRVCACDINSDRLHLAQKNARVYGVVDNIEWLCTDSIQLLRQPKSKAQDYTVCLLSPPWGGPDYLDRPVFHLEDIHIPSHGEAIDGFELLRLALRCCPNVIYLLPRNTSLKDLKLAGQHNGSQFCLVEDLCLHGKCKMRVAYFGPLFVASV